MVSFLQVFCLTVYMYFLPPQVYYISLPLYSPCCDHANNIWGRVQITKLIM
jgi:hypothetical protein